MSDVVLSKIENGLGIITINSEKSLNSLSQKIVENIYQVLQLWKRDQSVACIFLQGAGDKAFCAGGDVRNLYHALQKHNSTSDKEVCPECLKFFISEYTLDYEIHTYPKPLVVWAHGIVMGGGVGLMNGASHRVVTERTKFAMPEITIGLYPDVGATWFFNKLPPGWGNFLALTAARINAADCLYLGLADFFIQQDKKNEVLNLLGSQSWSEDQKENRQLVSGILKILSSKGHTLSSNVKEHHHDISKFEKINDVTDFETILEQMPQNEWFNEARSIFKHGSPSSKAIILEQLKRGKNLSLEEVFQSELNLSVQCALRPDFPEGVRALLIDKDQNPQWHQEVTTDWISSYFYPYWNKESNPLLSLGT